MLPEEIMMVSFLDAFKGCGKAVTFDGVWAAAIFGGRGLMGLCFIMDGFNLEF